MFRRQPRYVRVATGLMTTTVNFPLLLGLVLRLGLTILVATGVGLAWFACLLARGTAAVVAWGWRTARH